MRKNRINSRPSTSKFWPLITKLSALSIIIFLALFFIISYIWRSFRASDYFKIAEVITKDAESIDLEYLKGKNIFSIDLKRESGYILESFPEYAFVILSRVFPDRVYAYFIKRRPTALIKLYKYFAVDEEGVIFNPQNLHGELELPVIAGLETRIFGPKPGKKYNIKELAIALNIIKESRKTKGLKNYKIKKIDVVNALNLAVFIQDIGPEFLEVKLGSDNIEYKIALLAGLITAAKKDIRNIKYIDLRFKDPVIKFNDVKSK